MAANRFKLARVMEGKKQVEIAGIAQIPISTLSMIENGWLNPNPQQLRKLEKALPRLREAEAFII